MIAADDKQNIHKPTKKGLDRLIGNEKKIWY